MAREGDGLVRQTGTFMREEQARAHLSLAGVCT